MEYQEVQGLGSRYVELLIWILNMDVGKPSAACSLISFDYYVSIALNHKKIWIFKQKGNDKSNKNTNLKCVKKGCTIKYIIIFVCFFLLKKNEMKMISLFATKLYLFIFLYKHVTYIINTTEVRVCKTHSKGSLCVEF